MTRDEAVERLWCQRPAQEWAMAKTNAEHFIDQLVALGMLKLDEPKEPWTIFLDTFCKDDAYEDDDTSPLTIVHDIKRALQNAGLKIVEK